MHSIEERLQRITDSKQFQELKDKAPSPKAHPELLKLRSSSEMGSEHNLLEKYVGEAGLATRGLGLCIGLGFMA
eukprot:s1214_g9.t1